MVISNPVPTTYFQILQNLIDALNDWEAAGNTLEAAVVTARTDAQNEIDTGTDYDLDDSEQNIAHI